MKTSKITKIVEVKPWNGAKGTVYYHSLEMENGDKINIGKKKELAIGEELSYEITDTGQEYNKAKAVNPSFQKGAENPDRQKAIVYQTCLKEAANYVFNVKGVEGNDIKAAVELTCNIAKGMTKQALLDIADL